MKDNTNYVEECSSCATDDHSIRQSIDRLDNNSLETILSFLTFSEKVLFESLSKRLKTCIYSQQKSLSLNRWQRIDSESLPALLEPLEVIDFTTSWAVENGLSAVNKRGLKSLLKKCTSIVSIELDCYVDAEVLDIIGRHCPQLKSLTLDITGLSSTDLDLFGQTYGHRIEWIRFYYIYPYVSKLYSINLLNHCKNLRKFSSPRTSELISSDNYLPKLESVEQLYLENGDDPELMNKFKVFCHKYRTSLKQLHVYAYWMLNQQQLDLFLSSISLFNSLSRLSLSFETYDECDHSIDSYLKTLSENNSCLKYLNLSMYSRNARIDQIFSGLKGFKNLVQLMVGLYISGNENTTFGGSVQLFRSMTGLKCLRVYYQHLEEDFFDDIDIYLPNLSELVIGCETEISDKTIHRLSHLKKLKDFQLNRYRFCNKYITDESVCALVRGCPSLSCVFFGSRPNISNKTIEVLIQCANSRPKSVIRFECGLPDMGGVDQLEALHIQSFTGRIPKNLRLFIDE